MLSPLKYYKKNNKKEIIFGYSVFISHLLVLFENQFIAKVNYFDKILSLFNLIL